MVATAYLLGVSTRWVERRTESLDVTQLSKSQVSAMVLTMAAFLDGRIQAKCPPPGLLQHPSGGIGARSTARPGRLGAGVVSVGEPGQEELGDGADAARTRRTLRAGPPRRTQRYLHPDVRKITTAGAALSAHFTVLRAPRPLPSPIVVTR